ncbi:hypothetical protein EJ04DRAFT_175728 [Polyplosphaeria fusca]|uniref:Uncharacterized protein n=1 Tax=Polyplosphaeria fusca TaxID=682080 RepID=A0A9P4R3L0_9PLEO|nr:hypothetical protein EJ04DRAFT_175728 [Polyplosphaeria fusca]
MGGQRYTVEQLQHLKNSPLVQKPDGLPSIEQWMDVPSDQNNNANNRQQSRTQPRALREGEAAAGGENRAERGPLINPMGSFGRRASTHPDDTVLGPPKLSFTSASRTTKAAELSEKRTTNTIDADQLGDRFAARGDRWARDREGDRNRDKPGFPNGRRAGREDGEGWTNVKGRKSLGQDDFDRFGRNGDKDKHAKDVDADHTDAPARRAGRDKFDRWARREEGDAKEGEGNKFGRAGQGGWRDREREKDRDWTRSNGRVEEDPEWMSGGADTEKKQAKTQEDFQRWKDAMKAKEAPTEEKPEPLLEFPSPTEPPQAPSFFAPAPPSKLTTPLGMGGENFLFGNWGKEKITEPAAAEAVPKAKQKQKSKFANMFTKAEEPAIPTQSLLTPASPGLEHDAAKEEDKEGFQRILQMLGGTTISGMPVAQPGIPAAANGVRPGGISLEQLMNPRHDELPEVQQPPQHVPRAMEQRNLLENIIAPRPSGPVSRAPQARFNTMSPERSVFDQFGLPRPDSNRPGDDFPIQHPPSRGSSAQDPNLQALLNNRAREESARDREVKQRERDFLLTLMQQPTRNTPPQLPGQHLSRPGPENQSLPPFFEHHAQRPQGQSKGRVGPPNFLEESRVMAEGEIIRREAERRDAQLREAALREQLALQQQQQQQEAMRKNPRMPMGNFPDDPMMASLQRRNTAGEIPRQMTNMGIPSQPIPDMPFMRGNPGLPPTPQDRNIAPPPGFGAGGGGPGGGRFPPGFGGPGMGPSLSAANTPLGAPPGIPPRGMGAMYQGLGPNMPPQGPPQGYFPPGPPGYPPMGMRGGEDPRMMMGRPDFEQFDGPAGPNHRQAGRPPNMY